MTTEELFDRYRQSGDPADLGAVYDAVAADLFRAALALAPDAAAAEDALQGTFLDAMRIAERWERGRPLRPWLFGILRNRILEDRRRERRVPDPARLPPPRLPPDPCVAAGDRELEAEVLRALDELPEPYREVAVLRWRYGLGPGAIADAKRMPPGTVRSLLHRAQERMKRAVRVLPALLLGEGIPRGLDGIRREVVRAAAREAAAGIGAGAGGARPARGGVGGGAPGGPRAGRPRPRRGGGGCFLVGGRGGVPVGHPPRGPASAAPAAAPPAPPAEAGEAHPLPPLEDGFPLDVLVQDALGRPLPGIRVEAGPPPTGRGIMDPDPFSPPPLATAATDGGGRLRFTSLGKGSVTIQATGGAFAGPPRSVLLPRSPGAPPVVLILHPACTVAGTVRGSDGRPAAGVRIFARDPAWQERGAVPECRSGADGGYRLDGLGRGPCEIWAEPAGGVAQHARTVVLPGGDRADIDLDGGASLRIRFLEEGSGAPIPGARARLLWNPVPGVRVGRTRCEAERAAGEDGTLLLPDAPEGELELRIAWARGFVSTEGWGERGGGGPPLLVRGLPLDLEVRLARGATVEGRILEPDGRPVEGALVHFSMHGPRYWSHGPRSNCPVAGWIRSGADGSFRVEGVPAGRAILWVSSNRHRPPVEPKAGREFGDFPAGMRIECAPGGTVRRDLVLLPEEFAFVEGVVVDGEGVPMADVPIHAPGPGARSGTGGEFRVAVEPGKGREVAAGWEGGRICRDPVTLDLGPGEVRTGVRFTMGDPVVLEGSVRDGAGALVPGALVALVHASYAGRAEPWNSAVMAPAPGGTFRFEGVAKDTVRLVAWAEGNRRGESGILDLDGGEPPGALVIVLGEGEAALDLEGTVVDEEGLPVAGAGVGLEGPSSHGSGTVRPVLAVTGEDGRFRLRDLTPRETGDGKRPLFILARGFLPLTAGPGFGDPPRTHVLLRERVVEGIVVEEGTGRPLPGVLLRGGVRSPVPGGGNLRHCVTTRSATDGSFRLAGFPPGLCTVFAASPWPFLEPETEEWIPREIPGVEAGRADLRIEMRRGLAIAGRVCDAEGTPLAIRVRVSLREDAGGAPPRRSGFIVAEGPPDGTFRVAGLEAGTYRGWFQPLDRDGPAGWEAAEVEGLRAGEEDLRIRLQPAHTIFGRVLDAAGSPAGGDCRVTLTAEDRSMGYGTSTDEDGSFRTPVLDLRKPFIVVARRKEDGSAAVRTGVHPGPEELLLRLVPGRRLEGRILAPDGKPAGPGVPVRLRALTPSGEPWTLEVRSATEGEGRFSFEGLPDLPYHLAAGGPDGDGRPSDWQAVEREEPLLPGTGGVELRLEPAFSLRGRLLNADGSALPGYWNLTARVGGRHAASARPAPDGSFELRGLPRGAVVVTAVGVRRTEELGTVELPAVAPVEWRVAGE